MRCERKAAWIGRQAQCRRLGASALHCQSRCREVGTTQLAELDAEERPGRLVQLAGIEVLLHDLADLRYHAEAEQTFLGVETLCYELGDCDQDALEGWRKAATDKLELDLGSFTFDLNRYREAARRFAGTP